MTRFELLEWRDRCYRHMKYIDCTKEQVVRLIGRLNEGYTGPRFIFREVVA